jgi:hypothetical protein
VVLDVLPNKPSLEVSLQRVMAYMHDQPKPTECGLNLQPPPIYFSETPAVLVVYIGPPQFQAGAQHHADVGGEHELGGADGRKTSQYYLMVGKSWLTAPDHDNGPWTQATQLPAEFFLLPNNDQWKDIAANVPNTPLDTVPKVIATTSPAELILTNGPPTYSPIAGTSLMYVSNRKCRCSWICPTPPITTSWLVDGSARPTGRAVGGGGKRPGIREFRRAARWVLCSRPCRNGSSE